MQPRDMLDPKSEEFARRTADILEAKWNKVETNLREFRKYLAEVKDNRIWEALGYKSLDDLLLDRIGHTGDLEELN